MKKGRSEKESILYPSAEKKSLCLENILSLGSFRAAFAAA